MKTVWDCFTITQGSKVWPSNDPDDNPFDKFTCKICGEMLSLQMYGGRYLNEPSFEDQAFKELANHLVKHCGEIYERV
jgi:hypothetical protein